MKEIHDGVDIWRNFFCGACGRLNNTELGDGGWRGDPPSHPSSGRARRQMAPGAAGGLAGDEGQTGERDTAGLNL